MINDSCLVCEICVLINLAKFWYILVISQLNEIKWKKILKHAVVAKSYCLVIRFTATLRRGLIHAAVWNCPFILAISVKLPCVPALSIHLLLSEFTTNIHKKRLSERALSLSASGRCCWLRCGPYTSQQAGVGGTMWQEKNI